MSLGERKVGTPPCDEAVDGPDATWHREATVSDGALTNAGLDSGERLGAYRDSDLVGAFAAEESEAQKPLLGRGDDPRLLGIDLELQSSLDELRCGVEDPAACPFASDVDPDVVGVADEAVASLLQLLVKVVQHDVSEQGGQRGPLGGALLPFDLHAVGHDSGVQVCPDELEHAPVL